MAFDWIAHLRSVVDDRVVAVPGPTAKDIFTTFTPPGGPFVYNTDCWAYGIDLTGLSNYNDNTAASGDTMGGVLISPRHVAFAWHWKPAAGDYPVSITWVQADGTPVTRLMTAVARVVAHPACGFYDMANDIAIGYLDEDVPAAIKHYPVLPVDYATYLQTWVHPDRPRIPFLICDQQEKALIGTSPNMTGPTCRILQLFRPLVSEPEWTNYWEDLIYGDSGHPSFLVFDDDEVVLVSTHYAGGEGANMVSGPSFMFAEAIDEINAVMAALDVDGTGYQLTLFDFDTFEDSVTSSESSASTSSSSSSSISTSTSSLISSQSTSSSLSSSLSSQSISSSLSLEEPAGLTMSVVGPAGKTVVVPTG